MDEQRKRDLLEEISYSLPSKRMLDAVNIGAVQLGTTLIILKYKNEYNSEDIIKDIESNPLILVNISKTDLNYEYTELHNKNVIFSKGSLRFKAIPAIQELKEHCKPSFKFDIFNVIIVNNEGTI